MLKVAIASENPNYDGQVYRQLLAMLLGVEVELWNPYRFSGRPHVVKLTSLFLKDAERDGIHRALVAVDNDGGANRRPEHHALHDPVVAAADPNDGCSECLLRLQIPPTWTAAPFRCAIGVPVQVLETWLLFV